MVHTREGLYFSSAQLGIGLRCCYSQSFALLALAEATSCQIKERSEEDRGLNDSSTVETGLALYMC